jgi:hypothetical protein
MQETQHLIINYQHNHQIQSDYPQPNLLYKHHPPDSGMGAAFYAKKHF